MMLSQLLDDYVFEILFLKWLTLIKPYRLASGERRRFLTQSPAEPVRLRSGLNDVRSIRDPIDEGFA